MENKNVAIIDIETYNALRDFKEKILKGEFVSIKNRNITKEMYVYNTRDEVIKEFERVNLMLVEEVKKLSDKIDKINTDNKELINNNKKELINKFSNYSVWEFLKWRKHYKKNK